MDLAKEYYRDRVSEEEEEDARDSHDGLLTTSRQKDHRDWSTNQILFLVQTCTLLLVSVAFVLYAATRGQSQCQRVFSTDYGMPEVPLRRRQRGFADTVAGDLGKTIGFKEQTYSNPIQPNAENTKLEIWWDTSMPRYSGQPEAQIDLNWDKLLTSTRNSICNHCCRQKLKTHHRCRV